MWACADNADTKIRFRCPTSRKIYTKELKDQAVKLSYVSGKSVPYQPPETLRWNNNPVRIMTRRAEQKP
jgi:hypothetical protein